MLRRLHSGPGAWWRWVRLAVFGKDVARREAARAQERSDARAREVELAARQERERLQSLGWMALGIAHDLNNVLTVILGNSRLALDDFDPADQRTRLERIRSAAAHAAGLTAQVLAYSGKAGPAFEPVDVSRLASGMLDLLRAAVSERTRIAAHLPDGLPAVEGDPTQLRQVLLNLVTNASEALGGAGGAVRIRTGSCRTDDAEVARATVGAERLPDPCVFLEVADSGRGIDPELRGRLFDPFVTSKADGRGLGLATVRAIVERHRGAIRVDTAPGRGATFRILLPCSSRRAEDAAEAVPRRVAARAATVLVVDDDAAVREIAQELLERGGFRVLTAASGGEAVERVRKAGASIDAVVLDLVLPDLSAEQTCLRIRELCPRIAVVLASGYGPEQAAERFSAPGLADFVRKPYAAEDLVGSVLSALRLQRP